MGNKKNFSKEYRKKVVELSYTCSNIVELANDLDIRPELLYRWRSQFPKPGVTPNRAESSISTIEIENVRLKDELSLRTREIETLRRTIKILSKKDLENAKGAFRKRTKNLFKALGF
jgi:transposase